jgi:hypothetical protein
MSFIEWFKRATFSGTILTETGTVEDHTLSGAGLARSFMRVQAFRKHGHPHLPMVRLDIVGSGGIVVTTHTARDLIRYLQQAIEVSESADA